MIPTNIVKTIPFRMCLEAAEVFGVVCLMVFLVVVDVVGVVVVVVVVNAMQAFSFIIISYLSPLQIVWSN